MTTNAGASFKNNGLGFNQSEPEALSSRIEAALKQIFRPEFLNRVDEIITFDPLTKPQLRQIVDLMLQDVYHSGEYQNIQIAVTDEVKEYLTENGYDEKYGARPLRRLIQRSIEDEIAEAFLKEEIVPGEPYYARYGTGKTVYSKRRVTSLRIAASLRYMPSGPASSKTAWSRPRLFVEIINSYFPLAAIDAYTDAWATDKSPAHPLFQRFLPDT